LNIGRSFLEVKSKLVSVGNLDEGVFGILVYLSEGATVGEAVGPSVGFEVGVKKPCCPTFICDSFVNIFLEGFMKNDIELIAGGLLAASSTLAAKFGERLSEVVWDDIHAGSEIN
jgi:hypothetical protein